MTIRMVARKPFYGSYGDVKEGDEIEVSESHAKHYERRGMAVPVVGAKMMSVSRNKMEGAPGNKADDPTQERWTGGRTGADKPASSLQADQPRNKRTYRKRAGAAKS